MVNKFVNIYEMYKSFFDNNVNYEEIMAMYNKYFSNLNALNYNELKSLLQEEMTGNLPINAADLMNKQQILREVSQMMEYGGITNPIMLYDENDNYYLVGLENKDELVVKPLNKTTDKSMICDDTKCMIQVKRDDGLIEESINCVNNKTSITIGYYSNESLEHVLQNIFLPSNYPVRGIDPQIVPEIEIVYEFDKDNNTSFYYEYESGILKSNEENKQSFKDFNLYELVHKKLKEINFDERIGNKRTK